jgi:hypothetical protein
MSATKMYFLGFLVEWFNSSGVQCCKENISVNLNAGSPHPWVNERRKSFFAVHVILAHLLPPPSAIQREERAREGESSLSADVRRGNWTQKRRQQKREGSCNTTVPSATKPNYSLPHNGLEYFILTKLVMQNSSVLFLSLGSQYNLIKKETQANFSS